MKNRSGVIIFILLIIIGILVYKNYIHPKFSQPTPNGDSVKNTSSIFLIDSLTSEAVVVPYVKEHGLLPAYYITKKEARKKGWIASEGNLCNVLPGKAIGGDIFSNREGQLPKKNGRQWKEADLNYHCGHRNAYRLLFSNDGLVFVTMDHYKTFLRQ
ncbi:MAG: ribonuclease domain-containing protein [Niabella sp.]